MGELGNKLWCQTWDTDRNALAELLEALDSRQDTEERRREERYTALIERVGLALSTAPAPTGTPVMSVPKAWAMKMMAQDDPEVYLVTFERLQRREGGRSVTLRSLNG
ncbi:UNVERIFIED_CONTAM: hypothetical protein FKN15_054958 [Acipenser sinensis]